MLHHQDAVHNLRGPRHPALMTRHRLSRADEGALSSEHAVEGHRLVHVTLRCRGGVGVDIVDVVELHARILHRPGHRYHAAVVAGLGDTAAVAREAVAHDLCQYRRPTGHGVVVVLQHECRSTAAGYQSVAILVKRATGFRRLVHADGECPQRVERSHRVVVRLLGTAAEHHLLQSLPDEHVAQTYRVTAAGAGRTDGEVHAPQVEDGTQVHVHRRVHRLEDHAVAQHCRVVLLIHDLRRLDDGLGRRVVAEDTAYLVLAQVLISDLRLSERLA